MKTIQLTVSMLYTGFVGLRESEITTNHPLGPHLHYLGSEQLDLGLTSSCYAISQNQTFLLTIETINGERTVVAQKTYWGVDEAYEQLEQYAIEYEDTGYWINAIGDRRLFVSIVENPGDPKALSVGIY